MSARLHRVTVGLTQEELSRLDHYRERGRLPRGTALRIAALETIPELPAGSPAEVPAGSPGEADTPELPAGSPAEVSGSPGKADTPEVPESAADQPKDDIDARLARMGREVEIFVQRGGWSGLAKNRAQRR